MEVLTDKVKIYAKKFKEFDSRIIEGVGVCYRHSPTFRAHVNSPHFGETRGWRITWLWTPHVKQYPILKFVGPLDLGLYSVRIDGILGQTDISKFVAEARTISMFQEYITATAEFIAELLHNGDNSWIHVNGSSVEPALLLCEEYSSTFRAIRKNGRPNGWDIVKLWTNNPEEITALQEIFPLDIGIYCVRLDSIIQGIELTDFGKQLEELPAFKLFPREVMRFILQILSKRF